MAEPPDESNRLTVAEDGEPIITIGGAATLLNIPYNTVKQWANDGMVGQGYESAGFRYKRYSWKKMQEVAAWQKKENMPPPNEAVA